MISFVSGEGRDSARRPVTPRNQTTDLSERAQNILLYKERDSVLAQNDTASFHLDAALKKLLLVYHASFSSARKKAPHWSSLEFKRVLQWGIARSVCHRSAVVDANQGRGARAGGGQVGIGIASGVDVGLDGDRAGVEVDVGRIGARCHANVDAFRGHGVLLMLSEKKMARISPGTHTELRNQTTDLSERAQNILLYKERDSVLAQNDTASFHLDAALKKLLLVYHASFSSARKKNSPLESLRGRGLL